MSLSPYFDGAGKRRGDLTPRAISVALHGIAFIALIHAPSIRLPQPAQSEYKQAIAGKEQKLVWYKFKELPAVIPPRARAERKPVRAAVKAKQQIVAARKDAPKRIQMVWTPAPAIPEPKPVALPNILAVRMPEIARPFVIPPDVVKPPAAKIEIAANAPEIRTLPLDPVKLADHAKILKPFVPPPRRVPQKITEIVHVDRAPTVETDIAAPDLDYVVKEPTRPFTAPPRKQTALARPAIVDVPAPEIQAANSRDLSLAAVGLNPANVAIALPRDSSPAQFSAGPKIRRDGANAAGAANGVSVPDLYVQGSREAKPDLIAQTFAAPTSDLALHSAARLATPRPNAEAHESNPPGAVKVSSAPDPRFNGRDIYMMAIQMPNLTSYSGSWLMWYADRTAREAGLAPISPPEAHRKVDPKYIASAASDKIEGKVQLACVIGKDGRVSNIELVRGIDERLDRSAEEAMSKWEFTPATRHGEPVAVDVVVEIPFRLAPPAPVPYSR